MNNVASSYPQEMTTMSPDYGTARYGIPDTYNNPSMGLTIPLANNGLPNSSLSSSPSFSDWNKTNYYLIAQFYWKFDKFPIFKTNFG